MVNGPLVGRFRLQFRTGPGRSLHACVRVREARWLAARARCAMRMCVGARSADGMRVCVRAVRACRGDCMWSAAKWTPYVMAIASEDFSAWLTDVRAILAHAQVRCAAHTDMI